MRDAAVSGNAATRFTARAWHDHRATLRLQIFHVWPADALCVRRLRIAQLSAAARIRHRASLAHAIAIHAARPSQGNTWQHESIASHATLWLLAYLPKPARALTLSDATAKL